MKTKLDDEGSELSSKLGQLKLKANDGKMRQTDVLDTQNIFRLIESIPSPNAEPFKMWLAELGKKELTKHLIQALPSIEQLTFIVLKDIQMNGLKKD